MCFSEEASFKSGPWRGYFNPSLLDSRARFRFAMLLTWETLQSFFSPPPEDNTLPALVGSLSYATAAGGSVTKLPSLRSVATTAIYRNLQEVCISTKVVPVRAKREPRWKFGFCGLEVAHYNQKIVDLKLCTRVLSGLTVLYERPRATFVDFGSEVKLLLLSFFCCCRFFTRSGLYFWGS